MRQLYKDAGFLAINLEMEVDAMGYGVKLCHLPYAGDHTPELRYPQYRPKDDGAWLLHGHVHTAWKQLGKQINVGVDQWSFAPVSLPEIVEIIKRGVDAR